MQIAQRVAGYSLGQADLLRKAMGKKDAAMMAAERTKFVSGAKAQGYDGKKADEVFNYIEPFARYGFNKSHSVAYALVAYQTAWLKVHYPRHFLAALMTSEMDRTDAVVKFINETAQMGIKILPPDINESNYAFTVVGPNIRFGLGAVKGVGQGAIESILEARRSVGRYKSLLEFCESVDLRACNKKVIEALIKSGSFDSFGLSRRALFESIDPTADSAQRTKDEKERGQSSLFGVGQALMPVLGREGGQARVPVPQIPEWPEEEKLKFEKETLGFYITGHPLNKYAGELRLFGGATTETLHRHVDETVNIGGIISQLKRSKIKKGPNEGKIMAKFVLDDQFGSVDVVVFSDLYAKYAKWLENGVAVLVTASVKDTGGMAAGRSASLQSAEQSAQHIDDEYGGHPEAGRPRVSPYDVSVDEIEEDRDPKEAEREKYGDREDNFALFGAGEPEAEAAPEPEVEPEPVFASHAAAFHEAPITPELNALEIVPLEGIREKKVREIALEVRYTDMTEERVKRMREVFEDNAGEIPVSITIVDVPDSAGGTPVRMKLNQHFRVKPGPELSTALGALAAKAQYLFERSNHS